MALPRILFVDDEPLVLKGLNRALHGRETAWEMTFMSSATQALAQFKQQPFDVVVSDLAMPEINGISLVLEMRKRDHHCAFIMLTGTADLPRAVAAINQAEVFRFFTKPCATDLLIEGIQAALVDQRFRKTIPSDSASLERLPGLSASIGLAALNRVAFGVFVVDRKARLLLANRSGGEILGERDGLLLSTNEILRAASLSETERLHKLIISATERTDSDDDAIGMAVTRPSFKRPLNVLMCHAAEVRSQEHGRVAIMFVSDPERQPLPPSDMIAKLFGLSPSESRLVYALTEGHRLEDAAKHCGITLSTARTYLKQVFVKTGSGRQSELVKLVLTSPALAD